MTTLILLTMTLPLNKVSTGAQNVDLRRQGGRHRLVVAFWIALLVVTTLRCRAGTKPPSPLWTRELTWKNSTPPADTRFLAATPELVLFEHGNGEYIALNARTGTPIQKMDGSALALQSRLPRPTSFPVYLQNGVITRIDTDDDGAGHSQWPKYLLCSDLQEHRLWQFPAHLIYTTGMGRADMMMTEAIAVLKTGVCLAIDEENSLYGLRDHDGRLLWKQIHSPYHLEPQGVWKQGCFGFTSAYATALKWKDRITGLTTIAYVSAQTGKARSVLSLPFVRQVVASGDTLYVQTAPATFRAYSIPALLAHRTASPLLRARRKE